MYEEHLPVGGITSPSMKLKPPRTLLYAMLKRKLLVLKIHAPHQAYSPFFDTAKYSQVLPV